MNTDDFACPVVTIKVKKHPNADKLDVVECSNGYTSVISKRKVKNGERVVCIPHDAIVPDDILEELGLKGRLFGSKKNRVKRTQFRGEPTDCILYPLTGKKLQSVLSSLPDVGVDMKDILGIKERVVVHPLAMEGVVYSPRNKDKITYGNYDIEHLDKWLDDEECGDAFAGKEVYITEKIHGTWVEFSYHPQCSEIVTSKGNSRKELVFHLDKKNENNLYVKTYHKYRDKVKHLFKLLREDYGLDIECPLRLMGEIYGVGVQDLHYGTTEASFIAFDIYMGKGRRGNFLDPHEFFYMCNKADIDTVPLLYRGGFERANIDQLVNGISVMDEETIKEGIVIKPGEDDNMFPMGRIIAKVLSREYSKRKYGTEWN